MENNIEKITSGNKKGKDAHRAVLEIISNLPLRQREAVMLRYHDGLEITGVGLAMGSTPQSVATYLSMARKRLETEMDKRSIPRRDADYELIPMGVIITEALRFGESEFIPTEAEWMKGALEECRRYIFGKPSGAEQAAPQVGEMTIAAARAPFGAIIGALTTFLIAGSLALGITLGGIYTPLQADPSQATAPTAEGETAESPAAPPVDNPYAMSQQAPQEYEIIAGDEAPPLALWEGGIRGEDVPMIELGDKGVLLFSPTGTMSWALMNLILSAIGFLYALMSVERIVLKRKRERLEQAKSASVNLDYIDDLEEEQTDWDFRPSWLVTSIAMAILGGILFLLTEDTRNPMVLVDWWTSIHAIIFTVQLTGVILIIKDDKPGKAKEADNG